MGHASCDRRVFRDPPDAPNLTPIPAMTQRAFATGLALTALLLPCSAAIAGGDGLSGEKLEKARAKIESLVQRVMHDAENETVYECICGKEGSEGETCPTTTAPNALLASMLVKHPESAMVLQPIAVDAMRSKKTTEKQGQALIGVLLDTRSPSVLPVAEAMHVAAPERFCCTSVLAFSEMGSKPLKATLVKRVKKGESGVPSAAFLALQGDKTGKKILKRAHKAKVVDAENALDVLLAGYALEELGQSGALLSAQVRVHDATVAALDTDDLTAARAMAISAKIGHSVTQSSKPILSLSYLKRAEWIHSAEEHGELASADEIFEIIQDATPIG